MRTLIVQPNLCGYSETFLEAHAEKLSGIIKVLHGSLSPLPLSENQPILNQLILHRALRKVQRVVLRKSWDWERTASYLKVFREFRPDVVLAEYGPSGVAVSEACQVYGVPLVVHFHGYDASIQSVIEEYREGYRKLFSQAAAIIAVSHKMREQLIQMGAPESKVRLNCCGVEIKNFKDAKPSSAPPIFLSVGRFVEKKAPYLTLLAFKHVVNACPDAKLKMIGDGQLLGPCQDLATGLGLLDHVEFLGSQSHADVARHMQTVRGFVQHSIVASSGDSEGTPVAVLEASASGLPVVSTFHAGIPDVIEDRVTGFLVAEKDIDSMADRMIRLIKSPELAQTMGEAGRKRISYEFSMQKSISNLNTILSSAASR